MAVFELAIATILQNEGGLTDNPADPGGITKYGISLRFLRHLDNPQKYGFHWATPEREDVEQLTVEQAKALYKGEFWDRAPFDEIISQNIATMLFDAAINTGIAPAVKCAQRATWAVLKHAAIIEDDGIFGEQTLNTINKCSAYLFVPAFRSERAGEYRLIAERRENEREFLQGWLNRAYNT